jgi:hypothetical protein
MGSRSQSDSTRARKRAASAKKIDQKPRQRPTGTQGGQGDCNAPAERHAFSELTAVLQELSDAICVIEVIQAGLRSIGAGELSPRNAPPFAVATGQAQKLMNGVHQRLDLALMQLPDEPDARRTVRVVSR